MDIIKGFTYQPCTFKLTDPVKYRDRKGKERCLFREHVYSPDFLININPKYEEFVDEFKKTDIIDGYPSIYVDVKGTFNKTERSFSIDQKFVYDKYGFYIYKLIPKNFMKKFGIVEDLKYTSKTKKPSKKFEGYPMIQDIFKT